MKWHTEPWSRYLVPYSRSLLHKMPFSVGKSCMVYHITHNTGNSVCFFELLNNTISLPLNLVMYTTLREWGIFLGMLFCYFTAQSFVRYAEVMNQGMWCSSNLGNHVFTPVSCNIILLFIASIQRDNDIITIIQNLFQVVLNCYISGRFGDAGISRTITRITGTSQLKTNLQWIGKKRDVLFALHENHPRVSKMP